jgi:hypothetical protein
VPARVKVEEGCFATVDGSRWGQIRFVQEMWIPGGGGKSKKVQMIWMDDRSTSQWYEVTELASVVAAKSDIGRAGGGVKAGPRTACRGYADEEGNKAGPRTAGGGYTDGEGFMAGPRTASGGYADGEGFTAGPRTAGGGYADGEGFTAGPRTASGGYKDYGDYGGGGGGDE